MQNACREVERAIAADCRELLPRISAATPREISGIVGSSIIDWTPRLRRHKSKVCKTLRAAARLVRNGDVLNEANPDYPKVVHKFFTKVLTGLVGTSAEHKKLMSELRKVRKDSRLDSLPLATMAYTRVMPMGRGYDATQAPSYGRQASYRDTSNRHPVSRPTPNSNNQPILRALQRHFVNAKLPVGTCWGCEYLSRKPSGPSHSAKSCPHLGDVERALKDKGHLN
jgi:hypothetical protein